MENHTARFSSEYLGHKRLQLLELRSQLRNSADAAQADENDLRRGGASGVQEYEDDAQRLDLLENDGHLVVRDIKRLVRIERALEKIAEGTYGISDASGQPIPEDRLEANPDAVNTVAEQTAREAEPQG
jgi:DnaK suppressor protein